MITHKLCLCGTSLVCYLLTISGACALLKTDKKPRLWYESRINLLWDDGFFCFGVKTTPLTERCQMNFLTKFKLIMLSGVCVGMNALAATDDVANTEPKKETITVEDTSVVQMDAVATPTNVSTTQIIDESQKAGDFSLSAGLEYSAKASSEDNVERETSLDFVISPSYKISPLLKIAGNFVVSKDLYGVENTNLADGTIGLSIKGYKINDEFETLHSIGGIIPMSERSTKTDRLQTGVNLTNGIAYSGEYFSSKYSVRLAQNFHEFNLNANYSPNIQYVVTQSLSFSIPLFNQFSTALAGAYKWAQTYGGFDRYSFGIRGDLIYEVSSQFSTNLGFSTDGSALKSNGVDSNIQIFNEYTSVYRAGMSYSF